MGILDLIKQKEGLQSVLPQFRDAGMSKIPLPETTISAAPVQKKQLRDFLPTPIREGLFGKTDAASLVGEKRDTGLLGFLFMSANKNETEKVMERYQRIRSLGYDEKKALDFAVNDVRNVPQELPDDVKKTLFIPKFKENAGFALDVIGNTPVVAASKNVSTILFRNIAKSSDKGAILNNLKTLSPQLSTSDQLDTLASRLVDVTDPVKVQSLVDETLQSTLPKSAVQPYTETGDLTTKILKDLEGKTTVSKQYILDATNRGELKQTERDLIRQALETEGDTVNVSTFANKVKAELLPLERKSLNKKPDSTDIFYGRGSGQVYENIALPSELRGNVKNYDENIYESPVTTSAGRVHFADKTDNYFGHTRIEDMADDETRRVIEVQSDLYQKGNLEREYKNEIGTGLNREAAIAEAKKNPNSYVAKQLAREKEVSKLAQYNDPTAHFRMIREEVKKAAQDGKTKLQFPTGETAMKIEGLGSPQRWSEVIDYKGEAQLGRRLKPEDLIVGKRVSSDNLTDDWVITEVLEDGKFKAVPRYYVELEVKNNKQLLDKYGDDYAKAAKEVNDAFSGRSETFDISGKVDQNNPIFKFYEKEVGKYLKNKYGAQLVTDNKGVSWWEIPVKKEYGGAVEAFKLGEETAYTKTLAELKADFKRITGQDVPVFLKDSFDDPNKLGQMSKGIIELLQKGDKVSDFVGKHELWHLIKRGMVTKEERFIIENLESDLVKAFPKKVAKLKKDGYTDSEIAEELMADEFAQYYKTGKTFSEKIKIIYDKIVQRLEMFLKNKSEVLSYFKNIETKLTGEIKANGGTASKQISDIDRAISDGKIRVVSREGRDVYQVKQGDEWVSKRDEDSALKAIQPKPKTPSKAIPVPPELEGRLIAAQISREELNANPLKQLSKYAAKTGEFKGTLKEVTGKEGSTFGQKGDDIVERGDFKAYGIEDAEQAREAYIQYRARVADNEAEIREVRDAIKQARLEAKALQGESEAISELVQPEYTTLPTTPEAIQTLEETASRQLEDLSLSDAMLPAQKPLSLEEIITQTPLKSKVNLLDYIRTPDRVLKKIGFEKEAKMLRDGYDKYVVELPKNIDKITQWYEKAPKGSGERIFKYLDGEDIKLTPEEQQIATEIREYLKDWADRLKLPEDKRITNYITHVFDEELIAKEFDEDLAKLLTDKVAGQVYDPFLEKRLGAKGYKQDVWQALDAYTKRATRKANMDEALQAVQDKAGSSLEFSNLEKSQFDYIQKYISRVNMRPTEIDNLLDTTFKQIFGYGLGQRPVNRITSFMRRLTYRSFLGANIGSALRNLSQGVNTYAILGERDLAAGYLKLFSPTNRAELEAQGIFANNFIQDRSINATRKLVEKADKGLWFLFDMAEKVNRGSAYLGAKTKGLRKGMSEQEAIDYAKSIVRKTQFNYDPVDAPVALSSDLVKTLLQFQTYTTKQTEFLTELAKDKNFAGLARYALGGLAFVYTIGEAFGMEPKELLPINTDTWSRFELAPSAKVPKEIIKALLNVPDNYGNTRDTEQKIEDVTKTLWGLVPAGSQIKKTMQGSAAVEEGASYDSAGKKQFDVGGSFFKNLQARVFGKYANKEAKQYFDKTTGDPLLDTLKEQDQEVKTERRKRIAEEVSVMKNMTKEEAKARLLTIAETDEKLAEDVLDAVLQEKKGLTKNETKLLNSSVAVRAGYVFEEINGLSKSEQKEIIQNYAEKGIVTEAVFDEILTLLGE